MLLLAYVTPFRAIQTSAINKHTEQVKYLSWSQCCCCWRSYHSGL